MDGVFFVAVAVFVIVGGSGGAWYLRGRGNKSGATRGSSQNGDAPLGVEEQAAANQTIRAAIQELLKGLAASLESLRGNATNYNSSLQKHRESLEKVATIEDLRELERTLLTEVKSVQTANSQFRTRLESANAKVAEQQEELDRLQSAVGVDFLTEIPNRRALDDRMNEMIDRSKRYDNTFSLIIFDIDHFKAINDTHGHTAGDRILRAVAHLLDEHKRSSDFLARYGGEEFVMLLPETSIEGAQRLAEKTRQRVAEANFQFQKKKVSVTISAGIGEHNTDLDTAESFFTRVDAALYHAKETGRNRVELAESPPQK